VLFCRSAPPLQSDIGGFERRPIDSRALRAGNYDIRAPIDCRASARSLAREAGKRRNKNNADGFS